MCYPGWRSWCTVVEDMGEDTYLRLVSPDLGAQIKSGPVKSSSQSLSLCCMLPSMRIMRWWQAVYLSIWARLPKSLNRVLDRRSGQVEFDSKRVLGCPKKFWKYSLTSTSMRCRYSH